MCSEAAVQILGQPAFSNTHPGITVLSGQWSRTMTGGGGVRVRARSSLPQAGGFSMYLKYRSIESSSETRSQPLAVMW